LKSIFRGPSKMDLLRVSTAGKLTSNAFLDDAGKTPSERPRAVIKIARTSLMTALIAVATMISIPMPPPLSALMLAPTMIFVAGILLGPILALISSSLGSAVGYIAGYSVGVISVPPAFVGIFLLGIVVARGPMGLAVGMLRKVNEVAAMIIGVLVETAIFFVADWYLFGFPTALITLGTLVDLIHVPIAYGVLRGVRRMLKITYLE